MRFKIHFICLFLFAFLSAQQADKKGNKLWKEANKAYLDQDYMQAEDLYDSNPEDDYKNSYNKGNAQFRQQEYEAAIETYKKASKQATTKEERANAEYNTGNAYFEKGDYKNAEKHFKNALKNNPKDQQARENYIISKKKRKQQENNSQQNQQNQGQNNQQNQGQGNQQNQQSSQGNEGNNINQSQGGQQQQQQQGGQGNQQQNSQNSQPNQGSNSQGRPNTSRSQHRPLSPDENQGYYDQVLERQRMKDLGTLQGVEQGNKGSGWIPPSGKNW